MEPTQIPNKNKIVSVAEMQQIERAADAGGHPFAAMMEIAGRSVAEIVEQRFGHLGPLVVVLVGPGNNGGDGLVCARYLHQAGIAVRAYLWKRGTAPEHDYEQHFARLMALGAPAVHVDDDPELLTLRAWLEDADLVVDALLGTGASRPMGGQLAAIFDAVRARAQERRLPIVAVDCASGLNCDTGAVDPHSAPADLTVTFAYAKHGHYRFPGPEVTGELIVADIGAPAHLADAVATFVLTPDLVAGWLPRRTANSHKGTFGKVLLAVGSMNYPGAAYLSCAAAGRVGAGLVTGAVAQPLWAPLAGKLSETTWLPLPAGAGEAAGAIDEAAAAAVAGGLPGYDALVLGCGLGQALMTRSFVHRLLAGGMLPPTVIDADGLNHLAQIEEWPRLLPRPSVITPHPAELARLCGLPVHDAVSNRWTLARQKAAAWQTVVLAKGPYTVIADPGGALAVLPIATPALATAGTGDVLAGAIGGLLAQGVLPFEAACLGAWLHGKAGERCAAEIGLAGVVASDLLLRLPQAINELYEAARAG